MLTIISGMRNIARTFLPLTHINNYVAYTERFQTDKLSDLCMVFPPTLEKLTAVNMIRGHSTKWSGWCQFLQPHPPLLN